MCDDLRDHRLNDSVSQSAPTPCDTTTSPPDFLYPAFSQGSTETYPQRISVVLEDSLRDNFIPNNSLTQLSQNYHKLLS
jgi:hypothetical protein